LLENGKKFPRITWGGPIPRKGRPNRTNHYENQIGALLLAANLKQFNKHCQHPDGGMSPFIQTLIADQPLRRCVIGAGLVHCCRRWVVC
jgi:hypothetical protein